MKNPFLSHHHRVAVLSLILAALATFSLISTQKDSPDVTYAQSATGKTLSLVSKRYHLESPDVAMNKNGDVVIVWQEKKGRSYDIFAIQTHINRNIMNQYLQINSYTKGDQKRPSVGIDKKGNFVVIWESFRQDGSEAGVFGQIFDHSGLKNGVEFRVNDTTEKSQASPNVSMNDLGDFAVTWVSESKYAQEKRIFLKLFSYEKGAITKEIKADKIETSSKNNLLDPVLLTSPRVAVTENQSVFVVWQMFKDNDWDIYGKAFGWDGTSEEETKINSNSKGDQINPSLSAFPDEQFIVTWENNDKWNQYEDLEALNLENIQARVVSDKGKKLFSEIQINKAAFQRRDNPEVTKIGNGAIVAWQEREKADIQDENNPENDEKNIWIMLSQKINLTGVLEAEPVELENNSAHPYRGTKISSNGHEKIGVVWKGQNPIRKKGTINFKQFMIEVAGEPSAMVNKTNISTN